MDARPGPLRSLEGDFREAFGDRNKSTYGLAPLFREGLQKNGFFCPRPPQRCV
jgi:hypothetical protein